MLAKASSIKSLSGDVESLGDTLKRQISEAFSQKSLSGGLSTLGNSLTREISDVSSSLNKTFSGDLNTLGDTLKRQMSKEEQGQRMADAMLAKADSHRDMLLKTLNVDQKTLDGMLKRASSKVQLSISAVGAMKGGRSNDSSKSLTSEDSSARPVSTPSRSTVGRVRDMFSRVSGALSNVTRARHRGGGPDATYRANNDRRRRGV